MKLHLKQTLKAKSIAKNRFRHSLKLKTASLTCTVTGSPTASFSESLKLYKKQTPSHPKENRPHHRPFHCHF